MRKIASGGTAKKAAKKKTPKKKPSTGWKEAWKAGEVTKDTPPRLRRQHQKTMEKIRQKTAGAMSEGVKVPKGPAEIGQGWYGIYKREPLHPQAAAHPLWEEDASPIAFPPEERSRQYYEYNKDEFYYGRKLRKASARKKRRTTIEKGTV